jgi:ZIP family zinc transporter
MLTGPLGAAVFAGFAALSLVIGGWIAIRFSPPKRVVGLVLGFGAGTLISSVAYELVPKESLDVLGIGIALGLGAIAFYLGDRLVSGSGDEQETDPEAGAEASSTSEGSSGAGKAIVLGTILDGVPESLVLGIGMAVGGAVSVAFLAAVFISNLPEAIFATVTLKAAGTRSSSIIWMWVGIAAMAAVAGAIGFVVASAIGASGLYIQAFAAGALLTMIVSTMAPESVETGGKAAGLATILGFAVAATLTALE